MGSTGVEVAILAVLILVNGVFAMAELAVLTARKTRLQELAQAGSTRARAALALARSPNRFLATTQVGITLVGTLAGAYGGVTVAERLAEALSGVPWVAPYAHPVAVGVVVVTIAYFSLLLGELVPKRLAMTRPEEIAARVAGPMRQMAILAAPAVWLLSHSTEAVLRLLRVRSRPQAPVTEEEIRLLLLQGLEVGAFQEAELAMVSGVLRLDTRRAAAMMTPRREIQWLDLREGPAGLHRLVSAGGPSRVPVGDGSLDKLHGVLYLKELVPRLLAGETPQVEDLLHEPVLVPETMPALQVLEIFEQQTTHLALVVDEHGSVQGLISLHDVLRAIVGEVAQAEAAEEEAVVRREDGSWLLDGMLPVDELKALLEVPELPGEERGGYHTLGGFVMAQLGRIPATADHFEWGGWRFEVVDMDGHRVDRVLAERRPSAEE